MHSAMPRFAQAAGEIDSRKAPTLKDSPLPVKSMSTGGLAGAGDALCVQLFHIHAPTTNSSDNMLYVAYIVVDVSAAGLYRPRFSLMDDAMQGESWLGFPVMMK